MASRWNRLLVALLLMGHLALLSIHQQAQGSSLERALLGVFGPLVSGVDATAESVTGLGSSVRLASSLRRENEELHQRVDAMERELVRLHGIEEDLERLSRLSGYARASKSDGFVADVVYVDPMSWLRTLIIHTGDSRAEVDQPVVTADGLVGRIAAVSGRYAKVLLLTDRAAAVSAMARRTRRQGLVRGDDSTSLMLDNIPNGSDDVKTGDRVVTAGLDGVFPRGIPIGVVSSVAKGEGLFHVVTVAPAVDFGLLDQVTVLLSNPMEESVRRDLVDPKGQLRGTR